MIKLQRTSALSSRYGLNKLCMAKGFFSRVPSPSHHDHWHSDIHYSESTPPPIIVWPAVTVNRARSGSRRAAGPLASRQVTSPLLRVLLAPPHLEKRHPAISRLVPRYPGITRHVTYPAIFLYKSGKKSYFGICKDKILVMRYPRKSLFGITWDKSG